MSDVFHAGERELQRRAGVTEEARAVGRTVGTRVSAAAARFLSRQRLAVASSLDACGRVWASLVTGPAGFLTAIDPELLRVAAEPLPGDPLVRNLAATGPLGLLVIDTRTRQRMRFNGRGLLSPEGLFLVVEQAYGNCPKYIQLRLEEPDAPATPGAPRIADHLDARQREWIAGADTFFIASFHPEGGADASHRGGLPGFVRVLGPKRLAFPDYPGNAMFNTLGNLLAQPSAGLLFVDFASGDLLQLSGQARLEADCRVVFELEQARETPLASPLRFRLVEYSPASPPLGRHAEAAGGITSNEAGEQEEDSR